MSINDTTYGFPAVRAMQAEIDRLRAELAERPTEHECEGIREALRDASDRANTAEAAIARVRALCEASRLCGYEDDGVCREWCECGWGSVWTGSLEAALDGGTE